MVEDQKSCPDCKTRCGLDDAFCHRCRFKFYEIHEGEWFNDNNYLIGKKIGEGGMGSVWMAQRVVNKVTGTTASAAIKFLHRHYSHDRPDIVKMFEEEAEILARLNNPHIVDLTNYGSDPETGLFFIGMKRVEGDTLEAEIEKGRIYLNESKAGKPDHEKTMEENPLSLLRVIDIMEQILNTMASVHEQKVYHRDLKPNNLMLETHSGKDHVYVVDFGVARFREAEERGEGRTSIETIMGTYPYMSPEHFNGQAYGPESDIFSLGIIMYEMLTGQKPFGGDQGEMPTTIMNKIENHEYPYNSQLLALPTKNFSRQIRKILNKCLAKDPKDRYSSCGRCWNDLDKLRREIESEIPWTALYALGAVIGLAIGFVIFTVFMGN